MRAATSILLLGAAFGDVSAQIGVGPFNVYPTSASAAILGRVRVDAMPADSLDIVVLFDQNGVPCGASPVIVEAGATYLLVQAYGDDPETLKDEGVTPGDRLELALYDWSLQDLSPTRIVIVGWSNMNGAPLPGYADPVRLFEFSRPPGNSLGVQAAPLSLGDDEVVVLMDNDVSITGFQFDVMLPPGIDWRSERVNAKARADGFSLAVRRLTNGAIRVLAHSPSLSPISPGMGPVASLPVRVSAGPSQAHVLLSNAEAVTALGTNVLTALYGAKLSVTGSSTNLDPQSGRRRSSIELYPNPASDSVSMRFDERDCTSRGPILVDLLGRSHPPGFDSATVAGGGQTTLHLRISHLARGRYLVVCPANGQPTEANARLLILY